MKIAHINCNGQRYVLRDFACLALDRPLSVLKLDHIKKIDDALAELGPSGEVRIIK